MRNVYYRFNEKTKLYDRVYPSRRARVWMSLRNIFLFMLMGVGGYFVTSMVLGSPESAEDLREENARLQSQYAVLSRRFDEAMEVMADISQRDDNLYRVMFMADPVPSDVRGATFSGTNRYEEFENLDNAELVVATTQKLDLLERQLYLQSRSFDEIVELY